MLESEVTLSKRGTRNIWCKTGQELGTILYVVVGNGCNNKVQVSCWFYNLRHRKCPRGQPTICLCSVLLPKEGLHLLPQHMYTYLSRAGSNQVFLSLYNGIYFCNSGPGWIPYFSFVLLLSPNSWNLSAISKNEGGITCIGAFRCIIHLLWEDSACVGRRWN